MSPTLSAITPNLARVFGLRAGNATDERLARLLTNPRSACVCRYVYARGVAAVYVGGRYLDSVGAEKDSPQWLAERAERIPELPHLKEWAAKL